MSIKGTYFNITKVPRERPLMDVPISFPDLDLASLRLDLLEIKKKLKKGLPAQVIIKRKTPVDRPQGTIEQVTKSERRSGENSKSKSTEKTRTKNSDDEALLKVLGTDSDDDHISIKSSLDDKPSEKLIDKSSSKDENSHKKSRSVTINTDNDTGTDKDKHASDTDDSGSDESSNGDHKADVVAAKGNDKKDGADDTMVIPEEVFAQVQEEEDPIAREKQERDELLWDLKVIKRKYPNHDVPQYTEHDDVGTIRRAKEQTLKEIALNVNVNQYKKYMTAAFLGIELFCVGYLGIADMKGYFMAQNQSMETYEALLIEIGGKSSGGWGSSWPVEVRLIIAIVFNAAMFWLGKLVEKHGGGAMASIFKQFLPHGTVGAQGAPTSAPAAPQASAAPKMRGPSVKF